MKGLGWFRRGLEGLLVDDNRLHGRPDPIRAELVAGPVWQDADNTDEDGEPIWTAEIQTLGGYAVVATVHGGSEDKARERQHAIIAALAQKGPA